MNPVTQKSYQILYTAQISQRTPSHVNVVSNFVYQQYSMLLFTDYEVHTGKHSDRCFEVRTERSEGRTKS